MSGPPELPLRATRAVVDLGAIARNTGRVVRAVDPALVYAVVKADAYGHGSVPVARTALASGAAGLCVALPQEAIALRRAGIAAEILVLGPASEDEMAVLGASGVSVIATDAASLGTVRAAAARLGPGGRPLAVHLKVDTGMGRIGCQPGEAAALARSLADTAGVHLAGVFTHLASADEDVAYTEGQLARFGQVRATVLEVLGSLPSPRFHAENSAGAMHFPAGRLDAVRVGIALYGYPGAPPGHGPRPGTDAFEPALVFESRVSFVKRAGPGTPVSYGAAYRTSGACTLVTVPAGYADGVRRALSGMEIVVAGRRVPVVGRVTMDQLVAEGPADWEVAVGDRVVLLGGGVAHDAQAWARQLGTIPYEILTSIGARVPRLYLDT